MPGRPLFWAGVNNVERIPSGAPRVPDARPRQSHTQEPHTALPQVPGHRQLGLPPDHDHVQHGIGPVIGVPVCFHVHRLPHQDCRLERGFMMSKAAGECGADATTSRITRPDAPAAQHVSASAVRPTRSALTCQSRAAAASS